MRRRPGRWLDVSSFALGVLAEALAHLRAEKRRAQLAIAPPAPPAAPGAPPRPIDPAGPRRRAPSARSPRPRRRPIRRRPDSSSTP